MHSPPFFRAVFLLLAIAVPAGSLWAEPLQDILDTGAASASEAITMQQSVESIDAANRAVSDELTELQRQRDGLTRYNARLERQILDQQQRIASIGRAGAEATGLARELVPLLERMLDSLEDFIALDRPFLLEQRRTRIARLRADLDRADVPVARAFRGVLDAYRDEIALGEGLQAGVATIGTPAGERTVELLRVGRLALFAQGGDGESTWQWDDASRSWQSIADAELAGAVRAGIGMARGERAPALLRIPVPAPEDAP